MGKREELDRNAEEPRATSPIGSGMMARLLWRLLITALITVILCSALTSRVEASNTRPVTNIAELYYPSEAPYYAVARIEAEVAYQNILPGYYLVIGLYDADVSQALTWPGMGFVGQLYSWSGAILKGDATGTPWPCNEANGLQRVGYAWCAWQFHEASHPDRAGSQKVVFNIPLACESEPCQLEPVTRHLGIGAVLTLTEMENSISLGNAIDTSWSQREFSIAVEVPQTSTSVTTTAIVVSPTTITGVSTNAAFTINPSQTRSETTQTATTQTGTNTPGGLLDILQQNSLLIIAALAALVILFAVLAVKGRGRRAAPQQMGPSRIFCGKCGAENPVSNRFCQGCGQKLSSS